MKLFCTQKNLNKNLNIVEKAISRNTTLPILNNILFETDKGRLKLSATDLEIGINCWTGARIEKTGKVTVPARLLSNFISSLPNKKIDISLRGSVLNLKCENFKVSIKTLPAKDFPLIPKIQEKALACLAVPALQRALGQVVSAVAVSQTRPEISGALMCFNNQEVKIAGTDSYRLAEKKIRLKTSASKPISIIVPARTIHEIVRVLSDQEGDIKIALSENQALFQLGSINIVSRLIEGQYPDYKQIIPQNFKSRALVLTKDILNAVKVASLFSGKIDEIKLQFKKPQRGQSVLELRSESGEIGSNVSQVKAKISGRGGTIAFNHRYLLDGLQNIFTDYVELLINNDKTPAMLKPFTEPGKRPKDKDYLYLIMPIKN